MIRITTFIIAICLSQASYAQQGPQQPEAKPTAQPQGQQRPAQAGQQRGAAPLRLDQLEQRYWSAKDDDFRVVQNRVYSKEGRLALTLHHGNLMNDNFGDGSLTGLAASYYFNEHWGLELNYLDSSVTRTDAMKRVERLGTMPDHSLIDSTMTLSAVWIPFYAKMSVMDKTIIYFDMAFGVGVGQTEYSIQRQNLSGIPKSTPHISLDATQFYYLNTSLAVRLDVKYQIFEQERLRYGLNDGETEADRDLPSVQYQHLIMTLGLIYFF
jgi:outer membrane beta-barrel protein